MSRSAAENDIPGFKENLRKGIRWTTFIMLPVALGIALLAQPITRALFERENFTYSDSIFLSKFLALYALSILPYSLLILATRGFYSLKDTLTPAYISVAGVALNVVLNFLFMRWLGAPGIALSSTFTYLCTVTATVYWLGRRTGALGLRESRGSYVKMLVAACAMAGAVYTGLTLTRPKVVQLERGTRSALKLPRTSVIGNALVVSDRAVWLNLWKQLGYKQSTAPPVDFRRSHVVAVFGPESPTTTSLRLAAIDVGTSVAEVSVHVFSHRRATTSTVAMDAPTSPAYLLLTVPASVESVRPTLTQTRERPPNLITRLLKAPDAVRLVMLSVLGAIVYLGILFLLGSQELKTLIAHARARLKL